MTESIEIIGSQLKEKYLVFGSNGHIGSNLFNRLTKEGKDVSRGGRAGLVPPETSHIFNLASYGNKYTQGNIPEIYRANVDLPMEIIANAVDAKSIVLVSTSSVLLPTETPYSISKKDMEEYVKNWVTRTGDPIVIARPSTIIGIGEDENRLIPKLIHSAFTGDEMDFVGEPTHDYLGVEDFVSALILLSKKANKLKGHVFNVSFGVSISNDDVFLIVKAVTGKEPNIKRVKSMRSYDTTKWDVPNDKIKAIGWHPTKTIIDVVIDMVEDYKIKNGII